MNIAEEELGPLEDYQVFLYREHSASDIMLNAERDKLLEQYPDHLITFVASAEDGGTSIAHSYRVWAPGTASFGGEPLLEKPLGRPFAISLSTDRAGLGDLKEPLILEESSLMVIEQSIRACHPEARCVTFIVRQMNQNQMLVVGHSIWDVEDYSNADGCVAQVFYEHPFIAEYEMSVQGQMQTGDTQ